MRFRFIRVLFAAVAVATGGTGATTGAQAQPASSSDTYVSYWDSIGNQAFTAAALAPPEGAVIFANVGIAEYDSVLAIEGGYQPFAVDLDAPDGASPEAAVVAAAHAILAHYLPDQGATILDPAYVQSLGTIPDGQAKDDGVATGGRGRGHPDRATCRRRIPRPGDVHTTGPADPRCLDPDRTITADRHLLAVHAPVRPRLAGPVPPRRAAAALEQALGRGLQRGQRDRLANEHDAYPRADAGGALLGRASTPAGAASASSSSTVGWTSATRHGSWR